MKNKNPILSREQINKVMSLYSQGKFEEAIVQIKVLNEIYPNVPLLFNLIGACYRQLGQLDGSIKMFKIAVELQPDYAEAFFNLGSVLMENKMIDEAIESYKKAISIQPNYPDAYNNLGNILKNDKEQLDAAIENLEWAIAYNPNFAEAHNNLGLAFSDSGRVIDAIRCFEKAISINSNYDNAYFNLAICLKDIGNKSEFIKNIEKAISLRPDWGDAYYHLCKDFKFEKNNPRVKKMESLLSSRVLGLNDRIGLNFALAHVHEKLDNTKEQFIFLNEANSLRKKELNYVIEKDQKKFSLIKEVFNSPTQLEIKPSPIRPIFIVGMPRSGTSLVHQIIGNHKEVYGAGELTQLTQYIVPLLVKSSSKKGISKKDFRSVRDKYLNFLTSFKSQEVIFLDKMPLNFRHIGFIFSSFPEAKVIHMNRDPMATCWSIYKYYFNGNSYSFNQDDLAQYYLLYKDLMSFWHKKFPNKIFDISYENLTINQEYETRRMLEYCELDWDENCLKFYENKSEVKTTSALQVRQKMYQGSSEVWKKYESYLQPLISGLNYYKS